MPQYAAGQLVGPREPEKNPGRQGLVILWTDERMR
jgi:hypothetical protein